MKTSLKLFVCTYIALTLGSCGPNDDSKNQVPGGDTLVNKNNEYQGPPLLNMMRLADGKFSKNPLDGLPGSDRKDLATTIDHLLSSDSNIVIYAHGGLVSRLSAYHGPSKRGFDSTFRKGGCFPYYIMYGGGPLDALWLAGKGLFSGEEDDKSLSEENMPPNSLDSAARELKKSKSFLYVFEQLKRHYSDLGKDTKSFSIGYTPIKDTSLANLQKLWDESGMQQKLIDPVKINRNIVPTARQDTDFVRAMAHDPILQKLAMEDMDPDTLNKLRQKGLPVNPVLVVYDLTRITINMVKRYKNGRDHKLVMTIVEEIMQFSSNKYVKGLNWVAEKGWKGIKDCTSHAFNDDANMYGGTALLDELVRLKEEDKLHNRSRKIYLIGSSTGCVLICHALKMAKDPKYKDLSFNIVFSVPACTFTLMEQALGNSKEKINSLFIFGLNDAYESHAGWDFIYPGTILYFVSGVCEKDEYLDRPVVGMQRYYSDAYQANNTLDGKDRNAIKSIKEFFRNSPKERFDFIWAGDENPNPNLKNSATRHTNVISNHDVQQSIIYILKSNFSTREVVIK